MLYVMMGVLGGIESGPTL